MRHRPLAWRALVGLLVLVGGSFPLASAATADPISDKRAQAQQVANQLQQLSTRAEQLAEKYNAARVQSDQIQRDLTRAAADVAQSQQRLADQRLALRDVAIRAYVGEATPTMATTAAAGDIAVERTYVDAMTSHQQDTLDSLRQATQDLNLHQQQLTQAQQKAQAAEAQVAKDKAAAASAVSVQQAQLSKVKGELATLVEEEQQRQAAAAAERARQEVLRQQALAAAAAASRAREAAARAAAPAAVGSAPTGPSTVPPSKGAAAAIAEAQRQLGKPYQWGAAGPGSYDCSGLTMVAWRAAGVSLDHYTGSQYAQTTHVPLSAIQPGDLIFYGSDLHHVGLYVGNGQMIEAPSTGYQVRYASIYRDDLYAASRPSA